MSIKRIARSRKLWGYYVDSDPLSLADFDRMTEQERLDFLDVFFHYEMEDNK